MRKKTKWTFARSIWESGRMELSTEILESLQLAGENAHISDKVFPVFLERISESLLAAEKKNAVLGKVVLGSFKMSIIVLSLMSWIHLEGYTVLSSHMM